SRACAAVQDRNNEARRGSRWKAHGETGGPKGFLDRAAKRPLKKYETSLREGPSREDRRDRGGARLALQSPLQGKNPLPPGSRRLRHCPGRHGEERCESPGLRRVGAPAGRGSP